MIFVVIVENGARGREEEEGRGRFESINITRNGKVINMDEDEMVRQNENDVRCTRGGNLITLPLSSLHSCYPRDGRGEERYSSEENRIFYTCSSMNRRTTR